MAAGDAIALARAALMLTLTLSGPLLVAALAVGLVIGLVQALTQIQEATLTFVPKALALGGVLLLCLPMMGEALSRFMADIAARIVAG